MAKKSNLVDVNFDETHVEVSSESADNFADDANEQDLESSNIQESDPETAYPTDWDELKTRIDAQGVEAIKYIIEYCKERLVVLQKEQIETLQNQMLEIQDKLKSLGIQYTPSLEITPKKQGKTVINPNNPNEVYGGFGKRPDWLVELLKPADGDKAKEKEILKSLRRGQE